MSSSIDLGSIAGVDVVDDLVALVADVAVVLEADRTLHRGARYWPQARIRGAVRRP